MLCLHECFDGIGVLPKREFKKKIKSKICQVFFIFESGRKRRREKPRCVGGNALSKFKGKKIGPLKSSELHHF